MTASKNGGLRIDRVKTAARAPKRPKGLLAAPLLGLGGLLLVGLVLLIASRKGGAMPIDDAFADRPPTDFAAEHLPPIPYSPRDFARDNAVHPRFGFPMSRSRLLVSISPETSVDDLMAVLSREGAEIIGSVGCVLDPRRVDEAGQADGEPWGRSRSEEAAGDSLVSGDRGPIRRPGDWGVAGLDDFVLGSQLLFFPKARDFESLDQIANRLWRESSIASVAYVGRWGIGLDRLAGPDDDPARNWVPAIRFPPSKIAVMPGSGLRHAAGRLILTIAYEAKVSEVNEALLENDVLVIGGLAQTGILLGGINGKVFEGPLKAGPQAAALREHPAIAGAAASMEVSTASATRGPLRPGEGAPPRGSRAFWPDVQPVACPERPAAGRDEVPFRIIARPNPASRRPLAYISQSEEVIAENWPVRLYWSTRRARPPLRFGRETVAGLMLPADNAGPYRIESVRLRSGVATVRLEKTDEAFRSFSRSMVLAIEGEVEEVRFVEQGAGLLARAPDPSISVPTRVLAKGSGIQGPPGGIWLAGTRPSLERLWKERLPDFDEAPSVDFSKEWVVVAAGGAVRGAERLEDGTTLIRRHGTERTHQDWMAVAVPAGTTRVHLASGDGVPRTGAYKVYVDPAQPLPSHAATPPPWKRHPDRPSYSVLGQNALAGRAPLLGREARVKLLRNEEELREAWERYIPSSPPPEVDFVRDGVVLVLRSVGSRQRGARIPALSVGALARLDDHWIGFHGSLTSHSPNTMQQRAKRRPMPSGMGSGVVAFVRVEARFAGAAWFERGRDGWIAHSSE